MPVHRVRQGDCFANIAERYGTTWERLWNHGANAALKAKRKNPNVLYPGDEVVIPDDADKTVSKPTSHVHLFGTKRENAKIRLRMLHELEPIAGAEYTLSVDGVDYPPGATDGEGRLEAEVPSTARRAKVTFEKLGRIIEMELGWLDPITEVTGVQARLHQLGFYDGAIDGRLDEKTKIAIWGFQLVMHLPATGEMDGDTRAALEKEYSQ